MKYYLMIIISMIISFINISNYSYSQNLIKNPSFEQRQIIQGIPLLPYQCSYEYENLTSYDEVTRCLGMYDYLSQLIPCNYPPYNIRATDSTNGGCNGWYNPFPEEYSTPDYFHRLLDSSQTPEKDVDVPNNYYNNYGDMPHKQEAADDNNNDSVDIGSEDAYVGIWNRRKMNDTTNSMNTSEYITQRFGDLWRSFNDDTASESYNIFLRADHYYHVKFYVSWTYGADPDNQNDYDYQTGHFLKGIGAFFSSTDPLQFSVSPNQPFLDISDNNPDIIYDISYFSSTPTYYNQTGGAAGKHWMTVENYYRPDEDKYFITIGNFQRNWNIDNRVKDTNAVMRMPGDSILMVYNFIDNIRVEEVPCDCSYNTASQNAYDMLIVPILKNPNDTNCCYKLFLKTTGMSNRTCRINQIKLFLNNSTTPFKTFDVADSVDYFFQDNNQNILIDTICFTNSSNTQQDIKVELFYDSDLKCEINNTITVFCPCGCDTNSAPNNYFDIKLINYRRTNNATRCCWDIAVSNESTCTLSVKEIYIDTTNANGSDISFSDSPFANWTLSNINGRFVYENESYNGFLPPTSIDVVIGSICIDQSSPGAEPVHLSMFNKNSEGWCDKEFTADLLCPDCCLNVHTNVSPVAIIDDGNRCCFNVNVQIDSLNTCDIHFINVLNDSSQTVGYILKNGSISLTPGTFNDTLCVDKRFFTDTTLALQFVVLDSYQNVICIKRDTIIKCSMVIPECNPDNDTTSWNRRSSLPFQFYCPGSSVPCTVTFDYLFRTVKSGNDVVHRDVQVTAIRYSAGCDCELERIKQIVENIWSNAEVLQKFEISTIPDSIWAKGKDTCFTNYRVITSDCWTSPVQMGGINYIQRCPDYDCCYAIYEVCYTKDSATGKVKLGIPNPATKLNSSIPDLPNCTPCIGGQCIKWDTAVTYQQPIFPRLPEKDFLHYKDCSVHFSYNQSSEFIVLLECEQKGRVLFQLIDLLGNVLSQDEMNKSGYTSVFTIDKKVNSGIYMIRIGLDNKTLFFDKINIIR